MGLWTRCARSRVLPQKTRGAAKAQLQLAVRKAIGPSRGFEIEERFDLQQYLKIAIEMAGVVYSDLAGSTDGGCCIFKSTPGFQNGNSG